MKYINVKEIINAWDPIGLLDYAPNDEYEMEINAVVNLLEITTDTDKLTAGIFQIFLKSFGEGVFIKNKDECAQIARMLLGEDGK